MDTKFNLYDLFGVFIPGAITCVLVYYFLTGIKAIDKIDVDWAETIIFIPIAYAVGTALHHAARPFIHTEEYSNKLLQAGDREFTPAFKAALQQKMAETFQLEVPVGEADLKAFRRTAFVLCADYVLQRGKGIYVENFNALYGMCRCLMVVTGLAVILALAFFHIQHPHAGWFARVTVAAVLLVVGSVLIAIFREAMKANASRYAIYVYRSFYLSLIQAKQAKTDTEMGKD